MVGMPNLKFNNYSFYRSGTSIVVSIPPVILDSLQIKDGDEAVIWVDDDNHIVIEKKKQKSS